MRLCLAKSDPIYSFTPFRCQTVLNKMGASILYTGTGTSVLIPYAPLELVLYMYMF